MSFRRELNDNLIKELNAHPLFKDKLMPDIHNGVVFPAIRNGYIGFYYGGGRLFKFDQTGFSTDIKYTSILKKKNGDDIEAGGINESFLKETVPIDNFFEGYDSIKKNVFLYSGKEREGTSVLSKSSYLKKEDIVLLDCEVGFSKKNELEDEFSDKKEDEPGKNKNLIDLLILNKSIGLMRFTEAKLFDNEDIWPDKNNHAKVLEQLEGYKKEIKEHTEEIKSQYQNYFKIINKLFNINLNTTNKPLDIDPNIHLFVFGYFREDLPDIADLKKFYKEKGVRLYTIGSTKNLKLSTIWTESK